MQLGVKRPSTTDYAKLARMAKRKSIGATDDVKGGFVVQKVHPQFKEALASLKEVSKKTPSNFPELWSFFTDVVNGVADSLSLPP